MTSVITVMTSASAAAFVVAAAVAATLAVAGTVAAVVAAVTVAAAAVSGTAETGTSDSSSRLVTSTGIAGRVVKLGWMSMLHEQRIGEVGKYYLPVLHPSMTGTECNESLGWCQGLGTGRAQMAARMQFV